MATQLINLTANSCSELNQLLCEQLLEPAELPLQLQIETQGWCLSRFEALVEGTPTDLTITVNGAAALQSVVETTHLRTRISVEPFWPDPHPLNHQQLRLSGSDGTRLLQLVCHETISPWQLFQLNRADVAERELEACLPWLITNGLAECNLLRQHPPLLQRLNQRDPTHQRSLLAETLWQRADLQQAFGTIDSAEFAQWLRRQAPQDHHWPAWSSSGGLMLERFAVQAWPRRAFGVNLFGYASEAIGIGEDLRTCQLALEQAGMPVAVIDIPTRHCSEALRHQALNDPDALAPYALNLFCLTAEEHARIVLELGQGLLQERWNIGYWPWELSRWPQPWQPLLPMVDEIWSSSRHTQAAISQACGGRERPRQRHIPLPLADLTPLSSKARHQWRHQFNLPLELPLVICSFDGRSSYWRKNPWASVDAFQQAFPIDQAPEIRLVIKTMHAGLKGDQWQQLQSRAQADPRLVLIDGILPRQELIGLYGCCDVLLSLHRAEGYGRNLAEALLLGLEVVATNYSGNTDFCIGPNAHPVPFELVPVQEGEYPHHAGQLWAEPNVEAASEIIRRVVKDLPSKAGGSSTQAYRQLFSAAAIGRRYQERLQEIWWERDQLASQLRFQYNA